MIILQSVQIGGKTFQPDDEREALALQDAHTQWREAVKAIDTFAQGIYADADSSEDAENQITELVQEVATEIPAAAEDRGVHHYSDRLLTAAKDALYDRAEKLRQ